jgi:hypothetical protein
MSSAEPQEAPSEALNALELQLRQHDAVMEPNVGELLKEYMKAGGKPMTAIEDLSDGFLGACCCARPWLLRMCVVMCAEKVLAAAAGGAKGSSAGHPATRWRGASLPAWGDESA